MERVSNFLQWKSDNWKAKASQTTPEMSRMRAEGFIAHAERQAAFYSELRSHFKILWADVPAHIWHMNEVIADPSKLEPGELDRKG